MKVHPLKNKNLKIIEKDFEDLFKNKNDKNALIT